MLSLPQNSSESIFSSPSDDFRLWCIGLSGSYRSLTHYSSTRMQEAKAIREKMVRFILDADEWIQSQKNEGPVTRKWNEDDYIFYQSILTHSEYCNNALIGSIASNRNFDLDGSTFLKELLQIIHLGTTHLQSSYTKPIEPVQYALKTVRELLSLVGFTQRTISPGKQTIDPNFKSYIPGGEEELVGEAIEMRACIRDLALKGMKNNATGEDLKESMKEILKVCDQARDTKFPSLGIEVFDEKMEEGKTRRDLWRWCNPIEKGTDVKTVMNKNSVVIPKNVPYEQYFQKGRYKDMFGDFDETGMPIQKKDGSIVSKSLSKKLAKKRNKFFERNNV